MTKRQSEDSFYCELCEKGFDYHSKYARHLQSANHKMFVESLDTRHEPPEELSLPTTFVCWFHRQGIWTITIVLRYT